MLLDNEREIVAAKKERESAIKSRKDGWTWHVSSDAKAKRRQGREERMTTSKPSLEGDMARQARPFVPPPTFRGLFLGSCSPFTDAAVVSEVLALVPPKPKPAQRDEQNDDAATIHLLYLGTATYDLPLFRSMQTDAFVSMNNGTRCEVHRLDVASTSNDISTEEMQRRICTWADIILVSGGNTLYAIDRWHHLGIDDMLRRAALECGVVICGGSAGAICWFDGGHSDSADPETFREAMTRQFAGRETYVPEGSKGANEAGENGTDDSKPAEDDSKIEISAAPAEGEKPKEWSYLRVPALGILPGLVCPHHDKVQSNGVHRSDDFDAMLLRHPTELGIGIDDWAALVVEDDAYRVLSIEERQGSVLEEWMCDAGGGSGKGLPSRLSADDRQVSFCKERTGRPGVWIKRVLREEESGALVVKAELCPPNGKISDLFYLSEEIVQEDEGILNKCRADNPQPEDE